MLQVWRILRSPFWPLPILPLTKKLSPKGRRKKGHRFECDVANDFKSMGFKNAGTTRERRGGNWSDSDNGIDLVETGPFSVQCKSWEDYVSIERIREIQLPEGQIPLLITKGDFKEPMAVLPWKKMMEIIQRAGIRTP